jgi:PucR family transcriptional regulator, purine catabolism regulatory protein
MDTAARRSAESAGHLRRLLAEVDPNTLARFCADALDTLEQHDAETGGALVRTLEVFAACGETSKTARALCTHRNTVLYRVQRIQELVGADIRDPEQRLAFHVALRAREVLKSAAAREDVGPPR